MWNGVLMQHDVLLYNYASRAKLIESLDDPEEKHQLALYNDGIDYAFSQIYGYSMATIINCISKNHFVTAEYRDRWEKEHE